MRLVIWALISFISLFLYACGPKLIDDPNAYVYVVSQYENEAPRVVYPDDPSKCKPQVDCTGKSDAECAVALYYDAERCAEEGERLAEKKLYRSARLEFMQALTRLIEAEIRLGRAKLESYDDWKLAVTLGFEKKIKEKIIYYQKRRRNLYNGTH
jgi:hypothetical protein